MTRLAVLSDLHFGLDRFALVQPLLRAVNEARADLVIIAGDIAHRGRSAEYERAGRFLSGLTAPWIAVPGNHDVPLFNLLRRLGQPYRNWHRFVTRDMRPVWGDRTVRVVGANSVDPMAWQRGLISATTRHEVSAGLRAGLMNVVVLHHPLEQLPEVHKELAAGAPQALSEWQLAGADIIITGHIHVWQLERLLNLPEGRPVLQIQTGTALCDRDEDRQNEFAVLDIAAGEVTISRHIAPMDAAPAFGPPVVTRYRKDGGVWQPA